MSEQERRIDPELYQKLSRRVSPAVRAFIDECKQEGRADEAAFTALNVLGNICGGMLSGAPLPVIQWFIGIIEDALNDSNDYHENGERVH